MYRAPTITHWTLDRWILIIRSTATAFPAYIADETMESPVLAQTTRNVSAKRARGRRWGTTGGWGWTERRRTTGPNGRRESCGREKEGGGGETNASQKRLQVGGGCWREPVRDILLVSSSSSPETRRPLAPPPPCLSHVNPARYHASFPDDGNFLSAARLHILPAPTTGWNSTR